MDIQIEQQQDKSIIVFDKNIIVGKEAAQIQNSVLDLIEKGEKTIVVDLSKLDFITSWGIGTLIHALTTCTNRNVKFYLSGVKETVHEILKKVKLDQILPIETNV